MPQRILVPTDFSPAAEIALQHAAALAHQLRAELRLLTSVSPPFPRGSRAPVPLPRDPLEALRAGAQQELEDLVRTLHAQGLRAGGSVSLEPPARAICALAASWPADLIALGTHGRTGIAHAVLGSVAERVLREAPCPAMTVRLGAREPGPIRRILVATDFSADARSALDWAGELADRAAARIALVHALASPGDAEDARARLDALEREFAPLVEQIAVEPGLPDEIALRLAARLECDLIAVGTRGLSGLEHVLLGSQAGRIVRRARIPVAVIKRP